MTGQTSDYLSALRDRAIHYAVTLKTQREALASADFWYPYGSINNFNALDQLLTGENRNLLRDIPCKRAADIGAADGDVSFFLEQEGWEMTIVDNPPTNWNGLRGAKLFRDATGSKVQIIESDLDSNFRLMHNYEVIFFMGILYHLKNPFGILEQMGRHARYCFLSTRIMRWSKPAPTFGATVSDANDGRELLEHLPLAYLLGPQECNNDATNYWIFSDAGLRRILDRTGWNIRDYLIVGDTEEADPFTQEHDARAFCLLESRQHTP